MNQSIFSKYKWYFLIFVLIIFGIISLSKFRGEMNIHSPDTTVQDDIPSTIVTSSPLLSVSPISPLNSDIIVPLPTPFNLDQFQPMIEQGIQLVENGKHGAAMDVFNEVLALDNNNFIAYNARGNIYTNWQEYENSLSDYSNAIDLEPFYPPPYYNRGRVYNNLGRYDEAIIDLQKSIELSPDEFGYRANGNIGLIYHKMGDYEKALEAFNESMSYDDTKADVFYFRGETYTALEDYNSAIADYQTAIERFARYDKAYKSLGYAHYKIEQLDQAMDALNQATTISPTSATAHLYKMLVYLNLADIPNAQSEANQGINSISELSEENQQFLLNRILADLKSFAEENPTSEAEELIKLIEIQSP